MTLQRLRLSCVPGLVAILVEAVCGRAHNLCAPRSPGDLRCVVMSALPWSVVVVFRPDWQPPVGSSGFYIDEEDVVAAMRAVVGLEWRVHLTVNMLQVISPFAATSNDAAAHLTMD